MILLSIVGYYRYKTLADSEKTINFTVNWVNVAQKTIKPLSFCSGDLRLKYLDKNGQYRFQPFEKYYETRDNPELIGTTNKFITNILSDQSNKLMVGYNNERTMALNADVPTEQLKKLQDIYTSSRVYLYIGSNNSDAPKDWLLLDKVQVGAAIVRRSRANTGNISIVITLPEHFTTKMI